MSRREQIRTAAEEKTRGVGGNWEHIRKGAELWFIRGAIWADSHPKWIPVEERLPEENQRVRAWSLENNEEYLCDYHDGIFEDFYGTFTDGKITHWMPIVPPRKEE